MKKLIVLIKFLTLLTQTKIIKTWIPQSIIPKINSHIKSILTLSCMN